MSRIPRGLRDALLAIVLVFIVGSIAMLVAHASPLVGFGALIGGALGSPAELGETLVQTTALLFPALGITIAFRAGLFNIGAEGQLVLGGLLAGYVAAALPIAGVIAIPVVLAAGAVGGGAWGALAGFLKARFGANEVIATLMLNVIAGLLATYIVNGPFKMNGATAGETASIPRGSWLPSLIPDTRLTIAFLIAIAIALLLRFVLTRTVFSFELRAAGDAPEAAKRAGIDLSRMALIAMSVSGAKPAWEGRRSFSACCIASTRRSRRAMGLSRSPSRSSATSIRFSSRLPRLRSACCKAARSPCRPKRKCPRTSSRSSRAL